MRLAFPGLMAALSEKATIVTPTPQLASVAIEQFNRRQLAAGKESWERPSIYSLDAWMLNCFQNVRFALKDPPSLLSLAQEQELWRQIIVQEHTDLFAPRAMAFLAQRASRVLAEYLIPTEGEAWSEQPDAEKFLSWHRNFQKRLRSENWITRADLWRLIPTWLKSGVLKIDPVTFAGLTSVSPGLMRFAQNTAGLTPSTGPVTATAKSFESVSHEMENVARCIRHLLEVQPDASIGILVCDLNSHVHDLNRILREVLYPSSVKGSHVHSQQGALLNQPVIANALLFLDLTSMRIHHASAGAILRSPFIEGAQKERSARALAAHKLRRARELDFEFTDIERYSESCPAFGKILSRVRKVISTTQHLMRAPDWSATFGDMLDAARWPGIDDLSDSEQIAVTRWNDALSELASLGLVARPMTLSEAVAQLQAILGRPWEQGDWSSPVQVQDASSAEGIEFDHAFVVNANEDAWPRAIALSPLIPYKLQRFHQVPGSHSDSTAEIRLRQTRSLFTAAPNVNVSFTGHLAPLFRTHAHLASIAPPAWSGLTANQAYPPVELEALEDGKAPAVQASGKVQGGSGILKSQSQCPFKAFAEYRLKARGDDEISFGFDALERGIFAHRTLELMWQELKTQSKLKALSPSELHSLLQKCLAEAIQDKENGPLHALISHAERTRLKKVIMNWLNVEKERTQSFTVVQLEEKLQFEIAGLKLDLRIDRIDQLGNGSLVLIDYKTGEQTKTKLEKYRPEEPQLLVYAAAVNERVEGLYFAELKNDGVRAVGHAGAKHFHKAAVQEHKTDWDAFIQTSKQTVERLATEFMQGAADVDPWKNACNFCKIGPLCRVGAAASEEEGDE